MALCEKIANLVLIFFGAWSQCVDAADATEDFRMNFMGDGTNKYTGSYQTSMSTSEKGHGGDIVPFTRGVVHRSARNFGRIMKGPHLNATNSIAGGSVGRNGGAGGASGYQQYMKQYAGDYSKYVNGGVAGGKADAAGGKGAGSGASGYQQYMKQYAGDYSEYMSGGSAGAKGDVVGGKGAAGGAGGYQQYMKQYAGDYSKYMNGGGAGAKGDAAGGKGAAGGVGDFSQYMKQYARHYQQYMSGAGGAKNTSGGASVPGVLNTSDANAWKDHFMQQYASNFQQYMHGGISSGQGGNRAYMELYAGDYIPHIRNRSDANAWKKYFRGQYDVHEAHRSIAETEANVTRNAPVAAAARAVDHSATAAPLGAATVAAAKLSGHGPRGVAPAWCAGALTALLFGLAARRYGRAVQTVRAGAAAAGLDLDAGASDTNLEEGPYLALEGEP